MLNCVGGLRISSLIIPDQVPKGTPIELSCFFVLDPHDSISKIEWHFRPINQTNFLLVHRYTPYSVQYAQFMPIDGLSVDVEKSEGSKLIINETINGTFRCTISSGEPTCRTIRSEKSLTVVGP
ncbi:hypothetical protein BLOT_004588 [Blomia tropicalis]|nr:hypothetical protein BLOT_004588 [Blomia tropicalis]